MDRACLLLLVVLSATPALAQYDEEEAFLNLEDSRRVSLQSGWRYAPNTTFYEHYYAQRKNQGLPRSGGPIGGPLLTSTFAYSLTGWLELGLDLFASYERMQLTGAPGLNSVTFGSMVGLRFQTALGQRVIPSVGILAGPLFAASYFDDGRSVESFGPAFGATAGVTLRLTPRWGLCLEYRYIHARGLVEDLGNYDAAGSWFTAGMVYTFPYENSQTLARF